MRLVITSVLCSISMIAGCGASSAEGRTAGSASSVEARERCERSFRAAVQDQDEMGYTRCARAYLSRIAPSVVTRVDGARTISIESGAEEGTLSLDRPYDACLDEPARCDEITEHFLTSIVQAITRSAADAAPTAERLRCAIRPADVIAMYRQQGNEALVTRPLVADLHVIVMVDFPESARPLMASELASLGLDETAALERARANVLDELGPLRVDAAEIRPGSAAILSDGRYYESSRLLDVEGLSALERTVGAPLIIAAPTTDTLLIATGADPSAPLALAAISQELVSGGTRPVGSEVLRFAGGRLERASTPSP